MLKMSEKAMENMLVNCRIKWFYPLKMHEVVSLAFDDPRGNIADDSRLLYCMLLCSSFVQQ